ncbi:phage antirepressor [Ligilactobacillus saerimneri]
MKDLKVFNFDDQEVRTLLIDDEPYFVGKDVATILGYVKPANAIKKYVPDKFKGVTKMMTPGGKQEMTVISEPGLYKLIFKSHASNAERFTDWVAEEVLPAIRKHGAYMTDEKAFEVVNNPTGLANLLKQAADQLNAKDKEIEILKPKADKYDRYLGYKGLITITEIAKEYGMSGRELNRFLHDKEIIFKRGGQWFVYQKYAELGLASYEIFMPEGREVRRSLKWTTKGEQFIRDLLEAEGIMPVLERPSQMTFHEAENEYDGEYYTASNIAYYLGLGQEWILKIGEIANQLHIKPRFTDSNAYCRKTLDENGFIRWEYTMRGAAMIEQEINKIMALSEEATK